MKRAAPLLGALYALAKASPIPPGAALAGPAFPVPSSLQGSDALAATVQQINQAIASAPEIQANETAWTVAVFSTNNEQPLYERYFTPDYDVGVAQVDADSVFRIASVSKVFSVWTFLIEVGDEHFSDPITKYVPELASVRDNATLEPGTVYDDIDSVRWDEVTLGQLASHLAGIPRDPSQTDMSASLLPQQGAALGLPALDASEIPECGVTGLLRPCSRSETIAQLLKQHPIFPTGHSPAYTNIAYTLLGFAQEALTGGKPVGDAIADNIFSALNMTASSFAKPPASGGVIPGGNASASAVGWDWDLGPTSPSGSIYSSTADLMKAGRAILGSRTLTPAQTRRWLKPMSQTGVLGSAVGAPWEVRHLMLTDGDDGCVGRLSQVYTKQGDLGGYRAALVLSPEHGLGAVVLSAGPVSSNSAAVRETLMNAVGSVFLPMAEKQARQEARDNFAGTYTDAASNSSVTIHVGSCVGGDDDGDGEDRGTSGLLVKNLISQGVEVIGPNSPFLQIYGAGQSARLFPTLLKTVSRSKRSGNGTFTSRLGFRASFFDAAGDLNALQDPGLRQWTSLGAPAYGARTLDDWVFEMGEDGKAGVVNVRMLRLKLVRERKDVV
ncbi:serine hydrolase [Microdochium nivale]|nr:serine hydrolase [Microdochium nivale]